MKNFKLMTLCLLGLSVYGLQAVEEAGFGRENNQVESRKVPGKEQQEENISHQANMNERLEQQSTPQRSKKLAPYKEMQKSVNDFFARMGLKISNFFSGLMGRSSAQKTQTNQKVNQAQTIVATPKAQQALGVLQENLAEVDRIALDPSATQADKNQATFDVLTSTVVFKDSLKQESPEGQAAGDAVLTSLPKEIQQVAEEVVAENKVQEQTVQSKSEGLSFGEPEAQVENQVSNLSVSSRQSLTLQPQETVVSKAPVSQGKSLPFGGADFMNGAKNLRTTSRTLPTIQKFSPTLIDEPVEIKENPKNQEVTSSNIATTSGDLFEGIAKENVIQNQQVEQPVVQEVVSQDQSVVVENPKAARIQELEAKGKKNLTLNEATELRGLKTQQTEVVTEISAIKQPGKIDTQAVDAQAMDAKTVESINNLIEKFNGDDIKLQVQSARDAYDKQYPNKTFGYKNTTAYKNGLKVVEAQAKDQALSDVKNEFATNADGSPRSNREILNALNAKYRPQSPAKPGAIGSKSAGSGLTMQQEMRVKNIIKEAKLQGETITQDKAIAQMRLEEEAKENQKPEVKVVKKAETPEEAQAKATAQAKAEAAAKLEAENNVLNEQIYQNDKASIDAQIKIQVDAAIKSDPKIRPYQIKDQIKDQIVSSKRESLSSDQKDQLLQQVADAKAAAKAEADEKAAAAKAAAKAQAEAEQEEADKRAAAIAAQAPVQDTASIEPPKMSLADQLAAAKAKKAAKTAAQAAQQAAQ